VIPLDVFRRQRGLQIPGCGPEIFPDGRDPHRFTVFVSPSHPETGSPAIVSLDRCPLIQVLADQ
jgi:hypothetical protein